MRAHQASQVVKVETIVDARQARRISRHKSPSIMVARICVQQKGLQACPACGQAVDEEEGRVPEVTERGLGTLREMQFTLGEQNYDCVAPGAAV